MASIATPLGPADHGRVMSLDEFLEAEEEPGYLCELARGVPKASYFPVSRFASPISGRASKTHPKNSEWPPAARLVTPL